MIQVRTKWVIGMTRTEELRNYKELLELCLQQRVVRKTRRESQNDVDLYIDILQNVTHVFVAKHIK